MAHTDEQAQYTQSSFDEQRLLLVCYENTGLVRYTNGIYLQSAVLLEEATFERESILSELHTILLKKEAQRQAALQRAEKTKSKKLIRIPSSVIAARAKRTQSQDGQIKAKYEKIDTENAEVSITLSSSQQSEPLSDQTKPLNVQQQISDSDSDSDDSNTVIRHKVEQSSGNNDSTHEQTENNGDTKQIQTDDNQKTQEQTKTNDIAESEDNSPRKERVSFDQNEANADDLKHEQTQKSKATKKNEKREIDNSVHLTKKKSDSVLKSGQKKKKAPESTTKKKSKNVSPNDKRKQRLMQATPGQQLVKAISGLASAFLIDDVSNRSNNRTKTKSATKLSKENKQNSDVKLNSHWRDKAEPAWALADHSPANGSEPLRSSRSYSTTLEATESGDSAGLSSDQTPSPLSIPSAYSNLSESSSLHRLHLNSSPSPGTLSSSSKTESHRNTAKNMTLYQKANAAVSSATILETEKRKVFSQPKTSSSPFIRKHKHSCSTSQSSLRSDQTPLRKSHRDQVSSPIHSTVESPNSSPKNSPNLRNESQNENSQQFKLKESGNVERDLHSSLKFGLHSSSSYSSFGSSSPMNDSSDKLFNHSRLVNRYGTENKPYVPSLGILSYDQNETNSEIRPNSHRAPQKRNSFDPVISKDDKESKSDPSHSPSSIRRNNRNSCNPVAIEHQKPTELLKMNGLRSSCLNSAQADSAEETVISSGYDNDSYEINEKNKNKLKVSEYDDDSVYDISEKLKFTDLLSPSFEDGYDDNDYSEHPLENNLQNENEAVERTISKGSDDCKYQSNENKDEPFKVEKSSDAENSPPPTNRSSKELEKMILEPHFDIQAVNDLFLNHGTSPIESNQEKVKSEDISLSSTVFSNIPNIKDAKDGSTSDSSSESINNHDKTKTEIDDSENQLKKLRTWAGNSPVKSLIRKKQANSTVCGSSSPKLEDSSPVASITNYINEDYINEVQQEKSDKLNKEICDKNQVIPVKQNQEDEDDEEEETKSETSQNCLKSSTPLNSVENLKAAFSANATISPHFGGLETLQTQASTQPHQNFPSSFQTQNRARQLSLTRSQHFIITNTKTDENPLTTSGGAETPLLARNVTRPDITMGILSPTASKPAPQSSIEQTIMRKNSLLSRTSDSVSNEFQPTSLNMSNSPKNNLDNTFRFHPLEHSRSFQFSFEKRNNAMKHSKDDNSPIRKVASPIPNKVSNEEKNEVSRTQSTNISLNSKRMTSELQKTVSKESQENYVSETKKFENFARQNNKSIVPIVQNKEENADYSDNEEDKIPTHQTPQAQNFSESAPMLRQILHRSSILFSDFESGGVESQRFYSGGNSQKRFLRHALNSPSTSDNTNHMSLKSTNDSNSEPETLQSPVHSDVYPNSGFLQRLSVSPIHQGMLIASSPFQKALQFPSSVPNLSPLLPKLKASNSSRGSNAISEEKSEKRDESHIIDLPVTPSTGRIHNSPNLPFPLQENEIVEKEVKSSTGALTSPHKLRNTTESITDSDFKQKDVSEERDDDPYTYSDDSSEDSATLVGIPSSELANRRAFQRVTLQSSTFSFETGNNEQTALVKEIDKWIERFRSSMDKLYSLDANSSSTDRILANGDMHSFAQDFESCVRHYALIIISEMFLPDDQKSFRPVNIGGLAGGSKYIIHNILFKISDNRHGIFESDDDARKIASHELKSLASIFECFQTDFLLPYMLLVDYKGFRIVAISMLPVSHKTLVFGSDDAGKTFVDNPEIRKKLKVIAQPLFLKEHHVHTDCVLTPFPLDIEVHRFEKDGKEHLVLLDLSRLFPPATPTKPPKGCHLFRLLRPEFLRKYKKFLSSDTFSNFASRNTAETFKEAQNNKMEIRQATNFLLSIHIPAFACELLKIPRSIRDGFSLSFLMHESGINMRYMGHVYTVLLSFLELPPIDLNSQEQIDEHCCNVYYWLVRLLTEMISRVLKDDINRMQRNMVKELQPFADRPYRVAIVYKFNQIFACNTPLAHKLWKKIVLDIEKKFSPIRFQKGHEYGHKLYTDLVILSRFYCNIDGRCMVFKQLSWALGFRWEDSVYKKASYDSNFYDTFQPFSETAFIEIIPRLKEMSISAHTAGILFRTHALFEKNLEDKSRLLMTAIREFRKSLSRSPDNKATLLNLGDCYSITMNHELAQFFYLKTIRIDPLDSMSLYKYALFLDKISTTTRDRAEEAFITALVTDKQQKKINLTFESLEGFDFELISSEIDRLTHTVKFVVKGNTTTGDFNGYELEVESICGVFEGKIHQLHKKETEKIHKSQQRLKHRCSKEKVTSIDQNDSNINSGNFFKRPFSISGHFRGNLIGRFSGKKTRGILNGTFDAEKLHVVADKETKMKRLMISNCTIDGVYNCSACITCAYADFLFFHRKRYDEAEQFYLLSLQYDDNNRAVNNNYGVFLAVVRQSYKLAKYYLMKAIADTDAFDTLLVSCLKNYVSFMKNVENLTNEDLQNELNLITYLEGTRNRIGTSDDENNDEMDFSGYSTEEDFYFETNNEG